MLSSESTAEKDDVIERVRRVVESGVSPAGDVAHVQIEGVGKAIRAPVQRALTRYTPHVVLTANLALSDAVREIAPDQLLVFDVAGDPVGYCLVDSLLRPAGPATGYTSALPLEGKMVEALLDAFPLRRELILLVDGHNDTSTPCLPGRALRAPLPPLPVCVSGETDDMLRLSRLADPTAFRGAAAAHGVRMRFIVLCDVADFDRWLAAPRGADAAYVVPLHLLFHQHDVALVRAINRSRTPALYPRSYFVHAGGLMALAPRRPGERMTRAIELLAQVLRGVAPADLPVQQPDGAELWINTHTAAETGLRPSLRALQRADRLLHTAAP